MKNVNSRVSMYCESEEQEEPSAFTMVGELVRGPALSLSERVPVSEARRMLIDYRVAAIAVIDDRDELRGLVTRTDVLRADDLSKPVADVMTMFVFALPHDASIHRAASLIACEGVGQVVVIGPDRSLLGIVSSVDIVRYLSVSLSGGR